MSLGALFEDRKARKFIRDGVNEAVDAGKGKCSVCEHGNSYLIHAFGQDVCESCAHELLSIAEDYENIFTEPITNESAIGLISEAYFKPDLTKLQGEADKKYKGDIRGVMKAYGLGIRGCWDEKLSSDGEIWAWSHDVKSGKTHLNKFLNDFDCTYVKAHGRAWGALIPDADGTLWRNAPKEVLNAYGGASGAASTKAVPSAPVPPATVSAPSRSSSSSQSVKSVPAASTAGASKASGNTTQAQKATPQAPKRVANASGTLDKFEIYAGKNAIAVTNISNGGTYSYEATYGGEKLTVNLKSEPKSLQDAANAVVSAMVANPGVLFKSFDTKDGKFEISKYEVYKFMLDEDSFGKQFSVVVFFGGKAYPKNRVMLSDKAFNSASALSNELTDWMEKRLEKAIPQFVKNPKYKTSVGTANFELLGIKDSLEDGTLLLRVQIGTKVFHGRASTGNFKDKASANNSYAEIILNNLVMPTQYGSKDDAIAPGFKDTFDFEDSIKVGNDTRTYTVYADYDNNALYDSGEIAFRISIIDDFTQEEQPKTKRKVVYRKAGEDVQDFLHKEGIKIFNEFFLTSNSNLSMRQSAIEKMKSPSKKAALLSRIGDAFKNYAIKKNVEFMDDLDIDLDMEVNREGKPTKVLITLIDTYGDVADDSRGLADMVGLEKAIPFVKIMRYNSNKDEPSVVYDVTDMKGFSDAVNLPIYENMIREAYNLVMVSESGRKTIYV